MENCKKVLITGILGQDGANMAEYLLKNTDHHIYGVARRSATPNFINIQDIIGHKRFSLVYGDLADEVSINNLVQDIQPDYFINFAANSFVGCSWDMPIQMFDVNTLGVLRCLEAIRRLKPTCRFYSAGSSEEFGDVDYSPQDAKHPIKPRSPYGASKAAARHIIKTYRESFNLYAIHGILFNHEGIKRSEEFVTRKITKGIARIVKAIEKGEPFEPIRLGNLDAKRDWSDSEDFCVGVWAMLNQENHNQNLNPNNSNSQLYHDYCDKNNIGHTDAGFDSREQEEAWLKTYNDRLWKFWVLNIKEYILSSNETHSIREFIEKALKFAKIEGYWQDKGIDEKFYLADYILDSVDIKSSVIIEVSKEFFRLNEVSTLWGDSTPARTELGWTPKISFDNLVKKMVEFDLNGTKEIPNAESRNNQPISQG